MTSNNTFRLLILMALVGMPATSMADDTTRSETHAVKKTYTNEHGGQLDVARGRHVDEQGNVHYGKAWKVTDKDGDLRGKGKTTATRNADGSKSAEKKSLVNRKNGETVKRYGQAQTDGQGNKRARRGKNVYDENGNLTRARRDKARNTADGSKTRVKKRKRVQ